VKSNWHTVSKAGGAASFIRMSSQSRPEGIGLKNITGTDIIDCIEKYDQC